MRSLGYYVEKVFLSYNSIIFGKDFENSCFIETKRQKYQKHAYKKGIPLLNKQQFRKHLSPRYTYKRR